MDQHYCEDCDDFVMHCKHDKENGIEPELKWPEDNRGNTNWVGDNFPYVPGDPFY